MEEHADHGSNRSAHFLQQERHMKPINVSDLIPKIDSTVVICITLIFLSAIAGLGYYGVNDRNLTSPLFVFLALLVNLLTLKHGFGTAMSSVVGVVRSLIPGGRQRPVPS